ncbi:MAG: lipoyl domain-containing protein [Candidatus Omnitrophota bacterium]|nr:lipoyl domain-containing protein [Candidatus Omnitrophota bacterium]
MTNVTLPPLAQGVDKASISFWFKAPGDDVKTGEDLVELVTDKATFNMPSPATGKIKEVLVNEGDSANVGQVIATIE